MDAYKDNECAPAYWAVHQCLESWYGDNAMVPTEMERKKIMKKRSKLPVRMRKFSLVKKEDDDLGEDKEGDADSNDDGDLEEENDADSNDDGDLGEEKDFDGPDFDFEGSDDEEAQIDAVCMWLNSLQDFDEGMSHRSGPKTGEGENEGTNFEVKQGEMRKKRAYKLFQ